MCRSVCVCVCVCVCERLRRQRIVKLNPCLVLRGWFLSYSSPSLGSCSGLPAAEWFLSGLTISLFFSIQAWRSHRVFSRISLVDITHAHKVYLILGQQPKSDLCCGQMLVACVCNVAQKLRPLGFFCEVNVPSLAYSQ